MTVSNCLTGRAFYSRWIRKCLDLVLCAKPLLQSGKLGCYFIVSHTLLCLLKNSVVPVDNSKK